jgi:DNA mismatch repair protein MSH2
MEKSSSSFVLITGPNMGGKSTFLRTVAIAVVLAHIGSFVPAEFASVCLVDKVIARIGAGDNQLQGQSTFMCEMVELADMIEAATNDSLLIIDEIGRGTSSSEGAGIAQGVCEYLSRLGCFTLFATHFSELISQDLRNFKVVQTEVILRNLSFELTHKILPGASNESYGIDIAEGNGIPAEIIEEAREIKKIFEELNCLINYG